MSSLTLKQLHALNKRVLEHKVERATRLRELLEQLESEIRLHIKEELALEKKLQMAIINNFG